MGKGNQVKTIKGEINETQVIHTMKDKREARPDFKIKNKRLGDMDK